MPAVGLGLLTPCAEPSIALGSRTIPPGAVIEALIGRQHGSEADVVTSLRVPRTLIGPTVGAAGADAAE